MTWRVRPLGDCSSNWHLRAVTLNGRGIAEYSQSGIDYEDCLERPVPLDSFPSPLEGRLSFEEWVDIENHLCDAAKNNQMPGWIGLVLSAIFIGAIIGTVMLVVHDHIGNGLWALVGAGFFGPCVALVIGSCYYRARFNGAFTHLTDSLNQRYQDRGLWFRTIILLVRRYRTTTLYVWFEIDVLESNTFAASLALAAAASQPFPDPPAPSDPLLPPTKN